MSAIIFAAARTLPRSFSRRSTAQTFAISNALYLESRAFSIVPPFRLFLHHNEADRSTLHQRHYRTSNIFNAEIIVNTPSSFGESVTEGDLVWSKAVGDSVAAEEVVAEIETDKVNQQVKAPEAGTITELLFEDGAKVEANIPLFRMESGGAAAPAAPSPAAAKTPTPSAPSTAEIPATSPPVPAPPTSPVSSKPTSAVKPKPTVSADTLASASGSRSETRVKMNRMRKKIAQRLKDAQNTCAMLTSFNEIDMSNAIEMRKQYKELFLKKHNLKLGFMSVFLKASAAALVEMPVVNGVIDGEDIIYRDYVDISVAVATPKGLVVPVVRNVERMNFPQIERTLGELGEQARAGTMAIEAMDGGTFTISNGGVFGSLMGTPIINLPQSAILGMHGIFERPVTINGKIESRPMMYVALTYDHRLIDGREAVTFLRQIKSAVEDPRTLLLEL